MSEQIWQCKERVLSLKTRWLTLIGETLKTPQGNSLDYWRIEKQTRSLCYPFASSICCYHRQCIVLASANLPGTFLVDDALMVRNPIVLQKQFFNESWVLLTHPGIT